jgi:hypothetical protein
MTEQAHRMSERGISPSRHHHLLRPYVGLLLLMAAAAGSSSAWAQQPGNPFAGGSPGAPGPYGSVAGATHHLMQVPQILGPTYGVASAAKQLRRRPASTATVVATEGGEKAEAPETPEPDYSFWEAMFVACSAGTFLGAFTALTTTSRSYSPNQLAGTLYR